MIIQTPNFRGRYLVAILLLTSLLGCLIPHNPNQWAAVVLFNETNEKLTYELRLSEVNSPVITIEPGEFDYVLEYDEIEGERGIPVQLTDIKMKMTSCEITLERDNFSTMFVKDPEGRNTWNLHVDAKLLKQLGCFSR